MAQPIERKVPVRDLSIIISSVMSPGQKNSDDATNLKGSPRECSTFVSVLALVLEGAEGRRYPCMGVHLGTVPSCSVKCKKNLRYGSVYRIWGY